MKKAILLLACAACFSGAFAVLPHQNATAQQQQCALNAVPQNLVDEILTAFLPHLHNDGYLFSYEQVFKLLNQDQIQILPKGNGKYRVTYVDCSAIILIDDNL
ncbi:MAG: hypothetical protein AAF570_25390 [Bacteroidota bacterium]